MRATSEKAGSTKRKQREYILDVFPKDDDDYSKCMCARWPDGSEGELPILAEEWKEKKKNRAKRGQQGPWAHAGKLSMR